MTITRQPWRLKLFYDGDCPLCAREVRWLQSKDSAKSLAFENIRGPEFCPEQYGFSLHAAERLIHAIDDKGNVLRGLDVFRETYRLLGFGWAVALTRVPILKQLLDASYRIFARNRLFISSLVRSRCATGACDGNIPRSSKLANKIFP